MLARSLRATVRVIACGGGVIKSPANTRALRQNGPCCGAPPAGGVGYRGGRPLSKGGAALKQLEAERTPLYEAASTVVLENNGSLGEAVDAAVKLFETDEKAVKAFPLGGRWRKAPDEGRASEARREGAVPAWFALISPLRRTASPRGSLQAAGRCLASVPATQYSIEHKKYIRKRLP